MSQSRRPAGTPVGGQFAPTNRPEASDVQLVDDDTVGDTGPESGDERDHRETMPGCIGADYAVDEHHALTSDPALARLDQSARRLAEHLGYDYAALDAVDEHHGLTTAPGAIGLVTYDDGEHFIVVGTSVTGHGVLPFGPQVFTPNELEAEIAKASPPGKGEVCTETIDQHACRCASRRPSARNHCHTQGLGCKA